MPATSFLSYLSLIPLISLQLTHLFHPSTSPPSRLRMTEPSAASKSCPMAGLYSPAPRSRGRTTCSLSAASTSSNLTWLRLRVTLSGKAHPNRSPHSPRKRWLEKRCVRRRTSTLKGLKGRKCTGSSSSRMGGKKARRKSGRDYCSSMAASRPLRVQCDAC
jgi:hypothetical protein